MKNTISPGIGWAIVAVVVVLAGAGYWYFSSPRPESLDVTKVTQEQLEDRDPPKRGQPGYRERTTDPPTQ